MQSPACYYACLNAPTTTNSSECQVLPKFHARNEHAAVRSCTCTDSIVGLLTQLECTISDVACREGAKVSQASETGSQGTYAVSASKPELYVDFAATDGILGSGVNRCEL